MEGQQNNGRRRSGNSWKLWVGLACIAAWLFGKYGIWVLVLGVGFVAWHFMENRSTGTATPNEAPQDSAQPQSIPNPTFSQEPQETWTCPHCGAVTQGFVCEYCDSPKENPKEE